MHQTIIGEEALLQLAQAGETPDLLIGCTGGGSNFGGLMFPFLREKWAGRMNPTVLAVEPAACPSLTQGTYAYDFGDTAGMTPLMKMHTLGHDFVPDPIHAGGLRYHGMSPLISHLYETGEMEAVAKPQTECFAAGVLFARTEGIVPAPEPTHALAATVEEAVRCKETGEEKVILTALCGHGHLDLGAYDAYLSGQVVDHAVGGRRHPGRRGRRALQAADAGLIHGARYVVTGSSSRGASRRHEPLEEVAVPGHRHGVESTVDEHRVEGGGIRLDDDVGVVDRSTQDLAVDQRCHLVPDAELEASGGCQWRQGDVHRVGHPAREEAGPGRGRHPGSERPRGRARARRAAAHARSR